MAIEIVTLAAAVALARLIPPAGFGEAVVPLIFVPLAVIFTFEGFGSALVQRKTIERSHAEAAMLASLVAGVALTAADGRPGRARSASPSSAPPPPTCW